MAEKVYHMQLITIAKQQQGEFFNNRGSQKLGNKRFSLFLLYLWLQQVQKVAFTIGLLRGPANFSGASLDVEIEYMDHRLPR